MRILPGKRHTARGVEMCIRDRGWGPQRTTNGENISRAIGMLAVLTGNVGCLLYTS